MARAQRLTGWLAVLVMTAGAAPLQDSRTLPGWGEILDPGGACTIRLDGQALAITVPATPHELRAYPGKRNAPRVLKDIEGNFEAVVKITTALPRSDAPDTASAGLLLWEDDANLVRLARSNAPGSDGQPSSDSLVFEYWRDGQLQGSARVPGVLPTSEGSTWLRLTRLRSTLKAETSGDGKTWTEAKTIPIRFSSRLNLGVVATNTTGKPLSVQFEGFQTKGIPTNP